MNKRLGFCSARGVKLLAFLLIVGLFVRLIIEFIYSPEWVHNIIANSIEKRYGFCTRTTDLKWYPCHIEPLMIRCIEPGGAQV
jgi:hypothetical protein